MTPSLSLAFHPPLRRSSIAITFIKSLTINPIVLIIFTGHRIIIKIAKRSSTEMENITLEMIKAAKKGMSRSLIRELSRFALRFAAPVFFGPSPSALLSGSVMYFSLCNQQTLETIQTRVFVSGLRGEGCFL